MSIGFIDKDFIDEGPFLCRFYDIQILDPSILANVKLWFSTLDQGTTWYMGDGVFKQEGGEEFFDFNGDSRRARELLDSGKLAFTTTVDEEGNETTIAEYTRLKPDRVYDVSVTYTSAAVTGIRAVGGRAEILLRSVGPIL